MLQVSVDGTPAQRVAWIQQLESAVAARDDVSAVVYQEAGPVDDLTGADAKPWALTGGTRRRSASIPAAGGRDGEGRQPMTATVGSDPTASTCAGSPRRRGSSPLPFPPPVPAPTPTSGTVPASGTTTVVHTVDPAT